MDHKDEPLIAWPLLLCARYGRLDMARLYLPNERRYTSHIESELITIVKVAAANGHLKLVRFFFDIREAIEKRQTMETIIGAPLSPIARFAFLEAAAKGQPIVLGALLYGHLKRSESSAGGSTFGLLQRPH